MKNLSLFFLLPFFFLTNAFSQSCLPDGIQFYTQEEIDHFQDDYPGCIEIEGDIVINNTEIANLDGLNMLTNINGNLDIFFNLELSSLSGLNSLITIGGRLSIESTNCINLTGLNNLQTIGDKLRIAHNEELVDLGGLENLTSIGGNLSIYANDELISLAGIDNLDQIGHNLQIEWNRFLTDLSALSQLNTIGGHLIIDENNSLSSLDGLDQINPQSIDQLAIFRNPSLSQCSVESLCSYLLAPNASVIIFENASGCQNPAEIANACGNSLDCLPYGNYFVCFQQEADNFFTNYPGCQDLKGCLTIRGIDITDLSGLNGISSIENDLNIHLCYSLTHLNGLETLQHIGRNLSIGFYGANNNIALESLLGLNGLLSIGGELGVRFNESLESLSGIDNISPNSISHISIEGNPLLSACAVESVCDYLIDYNGSLIIYNNASGCNSQQEIEEACEEMGVAEEGLSKQFNIYPNPASSHIGFSYESSLLVYQLIIRNQLGQKVLQKKNPKSFVDISGLSEGIYILELNFDLGQIRKKLLVKK